MKQKLKTLQQEYPLAKQIIDRIKEIDRISEMEFDYKEEREIQKMKVVIEILKDKLK